MEVESVDAGVARYRTSREARQSSSGTPEMRIIRSAMDLLVPAVEDLQYAVMTKRPMKGIRKWGRQMVSLPADKLALLTLRAIFECRGGTTLSTVNLISRSIQLEANFERVKKEDPKQFRATRKYTKRWTERDVKRMFRRSSVSRDTTKNTHHLGAVLLQTAVAKAAIAEVTSKPAKSGGYQKTIHLLPDIEEEINRQHSELEYLRPSHMPMVVPPVPWTDLKEGGYLFTQVPLVKESWKQSARIREFSQTGRNAEALNHIQSVPWKVNTWLLEVVKTLHDMGSELGGMVPRDDLPMPEKPADILTNPEAKQRWRIQARQTYEDNDNLASQRHMLLHQIWLAEKFKKYQALYYVWQLDWRGRMYPCVNSLSPQGDDIGRALLLFAEGKRLGDRGFYWLTIHLANQMGYDKKRLSERIRLVNSRANEIRQWADDPLIHKGWADKPDDGGDWKTNDAAYKCLAAAAEWAQASRLDRPGDFVSYIPIAMDGSCNGLQHLSALGLDPVGASSTNLTPTDEPNDVYREVAAALDRRLTLDYSDPDENVRDHATHWIPRVTRTLCKRPTMTTPYSVTKQGIRMQLLDDGFLRDVEGEINGHANYIRDRMHESIGHVVVAAREIMDWLQECARVRNQTDETLRWTTPTGFFIDQSYVRLKLAKTQTVLQQLTYWIPFEDRRLFPARQISGIAPNFIHSLDASHLTMVVCRLFDNGLESFAPVHDSFGTHAADTDEMHTVIREEFIRLYSRDLLADFREQNGSGLPPPPDKGDFDLEGVRKATYAFS